MKIAPHIVKTLADSADLINTINGGMSLAYVEKHTLTDHYLVTVKVPGVDKHALRIELHNGGRAFDSSAIGQLFVFQLMQLDHSVEVPYLVTVIELSKQVDRQAVHANYQGKNLNIVLPFGEQQGGSEIRIEGI